jgi:hypothetical protein
VILWSCDDESFGMTAELDVYRAANILVKEYGSEQAPLGKPCCERSRSRL